MDISDFSCVSVLVQKTTESYWQSMEYMEHWFTAPELNYSATKYKLLEFLLQLNLWRHYLLGTLFVVLSDNASLQ